MKKIHEVLLSVLKPKKMFCQSIQDYELFRIFRTDLTSCSVTKVQLCYMSDHRAECNAPTLTATTCYNQWGVLSNLTQVLCRESFFLKCHISRIFPFGYTNSFPSLLLCFFVSGMFGSDSLFPQLLGIAKRTETQVLCFLLQDSNLPQSLSSCELLVHGDRDSLAARSSKVDQNQEKACS